MTMTDVVFATAIIVAVVGTIAFIAVLTLYVYDDDDSYELAPVDDDPRPTSFRVVDPPPYDWSRHEGL